MATGQIQKPRLPWPRPNGSIYANDGPRTDGPRNRPIEFQVGGVKLWIARAGSTLQTGRDRWRCECLTCNRLLHQGTTGPTFRFSVHLKQEHGIDVEEWTQEDEDMKKYDPDSKETDAEFLRNFIIVGDTERDRRARARMERIAAQLEGVTVPAKRVRSQLLGAVAQIFDNLVGEELQDVLVVEAEPDESEIDFVSAERFVGLLRESADFIDNEVITDAGGVRGNDHPSLTLVPPRLREAATRIERAAERAQRWATNPNRVTDSGKVMLAILNGRDEYQG